MIVICLCYLLAMQLRPSFWIALTLLAILGGWGVSKILFDEDIAGAINADTQINADQTSPRRSALASSLRKTPIPNSNLEQSDFKDILALLKNKQISTAANKINERHSYLSARQLNELKSEFLTIARQQQNQINQQKNTLIAASRAFDELEVWSALATSAINAADWPLAHQAQMRASELESDPLNLDAIHQRLLFTASKLRENFEQSNDELSINALYQELSNLHPSVARFQLELAFSHLRVNDISAAESLLEGLSYDPEFGAIAQRTLTKINTANDSTSQIEELVSASSLSRNEVVIPLIKSGSSFLIDVNMGRSTTRLLLDTGASITALSSDLISALNLPRTGQSISLSTANGVKKSRLYKVERLQLGPLVLQNMTVAEIDLAVNNRFQGLLGTDVLNTVDRYNYVIDNQRNALIFVNRQ